MISPKNKNREQIEFFPINDGVNSNYLSVGVILFQSVENSIHVLLSIEKLTEGFDCLHLIGGEKKKEDEEIPSKTFHRIFEHNFNSSFPLSSLSENSLIFSTKSGTHIFFLIFLEKSITHSSILSINLEKLRDTKPFQVIEGYPINEQCSKILNQSFIIENLLKFKSFNKMVSSTSDLSESNQNEKKNK